MHQHIKKMNTLKIWLMAAFMYIWNMVRQTVFFEFWASIRDVSFTVPSGVKQ